MTPSYGYSYGPPLVQMQDVHLTLGGVKILDGMSLRIDDIIRPGYQQGQIEVILGPSGVGKSQTFWILAGLNEPTSGSVLIGPEAVPVKPGMVGVVTQDYILFDDRTVLDNLVVPGVLAGMSHGDAKEKAMGYLAKFGLEKRGGAYPAELSGGQRQRIAICQQLMKNGRYLLMDEPFSGLDLIMKGAAMELIEEVALLDELNTTIVVTHDERSAVKIADHITLVGRDRDPDGNIISGAKVQARIDLIERGLAWRPDKQQLPAFNDTLREIAERYQTL